MSVDAHPDGDETVVLEQLQSLLDDMRLERAEPLGPETNLADLGIDSLAMVELVDRVGEMCGVTLDDEVLSATTIEDVVETIRHTRQRDGSAPTQSHAQPKPQPQPQLQPQAERAGGPEEARTLTEVLAWHVSAHPDRVSLRLLGHAPGSHAPGSHAPGRDAAGGASEETCEVLTYAQLDAEARTMARGIRAAGVVPGDPVVLMLGTQRAYFSVFLGALLAGAVPVPLYPPSNRTTAAEHLERQARIMAQAGARLLVTTPQVTAVAKLAGYRVPTLRGVLTPDELMRRARARDHRRRGAGARGRDDDGACTLARPSDFALIQYTSGSTGDPKGVVLTHEQLLANIRAMGAAASVDECDVMVSWLPLYHDMGLIGAWLAPLYFGMTVVAMSPLAFLARPARWLEAISAHRGTVSAAPNFAYQLCAELVRDQNARTLDLSTWRLAFCGSEPVRSETIDAFATRFAPNGFERTAMCPAYGLAEAGVGIAFSPPRCKPRVDTVWRDVLEQSKVAEPAGGVADRGDGSRSNILEIVGCGPALPGYDIQVTDEDGTRLEERHEGEIFCRGPSMTAGYFKNDEATAALWHEGWLRTGDIGYLADGELFLTGRSKDLIIRAGRNLHPADLEASLGALTGVAGVAVFASHGPGGRRGHEGPGGIDRLVVVAETALREADREALRHELRQCAMSVAEVSLDDVVLVARGAILRTPSGKIRRSATRDAYEAGTLGRSRGPVALQLGRLAAGGFSAGAREAVTRAAKRSSDLGFGLFAWGAVGVVALGTWAAVMLAPTRRARWRVVRTAARWLAGLLGIEVQMVGELPQSGPAVVVANHASFADAVVCILASPAPLTFVTSTDFERKPVVGAFLRRFGCAFVARGEAGRAAADLSSLAERVRAGERLAIFPEGSIGTTIGVRRFHLGAVAVAADGGVELVPVGIRGSRAILPAGSYLAHPGTVQVRVGEPVKGTGLTFAEQSATADALRRAVADLAGEPLAD